MGSPSGSCQGCSVGGPGCSDSLVGVKVGKGVFPWVGGGLLQPANRMINKISKVRVIFDTADLLNGISDSLGLIQEDPGLSIPIL